MKKRITTLFTALLLTFAVAACGESPTSIDYTDVPLAGAEAKKSNTTDSSTSNTTTESTSESTTTKKTTTYSAGYALGM